jgi:equilibrative nucleoside transporter 1/2/3
MHYYTALPAEPADESDKTVLASYTSHSPMTININTGIVETHAKDRLSNASRESESERRRDSLAVYDHTEILTWNEIRSVLVKLWSPALSVFMVFTVTLSIFPILTVLTKSTRYCDTSNRFYNDLFVPFQFLLFNMTDFLGRFIAGHYGTAFSPRVVLICTFLRIGFIPMFLLLHIRDSILPHVFNNDSCPIIFMICMGLSNGYLASVSMMLGPTLVPSNEASIAGTIMSFCLNAGCLLGSMLSFPVLFISQGKI